MSISLAGFDSRLLNFSANCDIVGQYFATAHVGNNDAITTEYFRQALPTDYRENFTFADIENYILVPGNGSRWIEEAERQAKGVCWYQICHWAYLDFRGNPDITGVGVLVSYTIQCFLFSAFSLANFIYRGAGIKKAGDEAWWPEKVTRDAMRFWGLIKLKKLHGPMRKIREAQLVFLDASILFTLSVSVAAYASEKTHRTVYEVGFTFFVSGYVAMPLIPVYTIFGKITAGHCGSFHHSSVYIGDIWRGVYDVERQPHAVYRHRLSDSRFPCFQDGFHGVLRGRGLRHKIRGLPCKNAQEAQSFAKKLPADKLPDHFCGDLLGGFVSLLLGLYLMFLIFTWKDRTKVGRIVGLKNFEDGRLGFGQVVALWLWMPTVTEVFILWRCGMKEGLAGRFLAGSGYVLTKGDADSKDQQTVGCKKCWEEARRHKPYVAEETE